MEVDGGRLTALLPQDAIQALDNPEFFMAGEAGIEYAPHERVLGVVVQGEQRAYAISLLSSHWIINDSLGGEEIVITWCPLTYTAMVFSRNTAAGRFRFGESGKLLRSNLVMYDHETGSLWSQMSGQAVSGARSGLELVRIPAWLISWEIWQARFPDTQAVRKGYFGDFDPYQRYYESDTPGVLALTEADDRLPNKTLVVGIVIDSQAVAYPADLFTEGPVLNDLVAQSPIVVFFDRTTSASAVFSRRVEDRALTFTRADAPMQLRDLETGSSWDILTGDAVSGPLAGNSLERLPANLTYWFHWAAWYRETAIYNPAAP